MKRSKPSDGEQAEMIIPKKRKSARLLASKENDKETPGEEAADVAGSKDASATPNDAASTSSGSSSPNDNCSICLGQLENKSFTDSCFHTFCFVCLLEWSKVKAVCPLCKQPFKSIIHNVRSIEDYDQYYLRADELTSDATRRFRYRTTLTTGVRHRQELHELRHRMLLQRPSRAMLRGPFGRTGQAVTSEFRQRIYATGMRVKELVPTNGRPPRYRDISVAFFARNSASMHRLVPWLNRELNVLLNHHDDHIQFVLELILDLIKRFDIREEEFHQHIQPFFGRRTDHFIHEFHSFARAPYDIVAYDQNAEYDNVDLPVHEIESDDDGNANAVDDDSDVVVLSPPPGGAAAGEFPSGGLTPLILRVRDFLETVSQHTDTAHTGWDMAVPGTSHSWSPQYVENCPEDPIEVTDSTTNHNTGDTPASSSTSDVEIVAFEKPFESRTPRPICLSSDSDSGLIVATKPERKQLPARYRLDQDTRRRSRSLSSSKSRRTGHSRRGRSRSSSRRRRSASRRRRSRSLSRRRRSRSSSRSRRVRDDRRRREERTRRASRSPHDRRDRRRDRSPQRSSSSHRRRRAYDGRRDVHRSDGRSRSGRSGRRDDQYSQARSHIDVDSDSSHRSSRRHKRKHRDKRDRRERRRDDDAVKERRPTRRDPPSGTTEERRYKKHPTGHKHSKSSVLTTVKLEKDAEVPKPDVAQQSVREEIGLIANVAIRQEVMSDDEHRETVVPSTVGGGRVEAVTARQEPRPSTSEAGSSRQCPSSREGPSHGQCPSTRECPDTGDKAAGDPCSSPPDDNRTALEANCKDQHSVATADCAHERQKAPTVQKAIDAIQSPDPSSDTSGEVSDRAEVDSDSSSSIDVESVDPNMSALHQQTGALFDQAVKSVSDSDIEVQVVDTGSSGSSSYADAFDHRRATYPSLNQSSFPKLCQIDLSNSDSGDSSGTEDAGLAIDLTSPDAELRSVRRNTEKCISITDDDDSHSSGSCSAIEPSGNEVQAGSVRRRVLSVNDDAHIHLETTDMVIGDLSVVDDEESSKVEEDLKDALAANNRMQTAGNNSLRLAVQLRPLPNNGQGNATVEHFAALVDQESSRSAKFQKHSASEGDDNVDMTQKEADYRGGVQSNDGLNQNDVAAEHVAETMPEEGNLPMQYPSAAEGGDNVDTACGTAGDGENSSMSVVLGDREPMEQNISPSAPVVDDLLTSTTNNVRIEMSSRVKEALSSVGLNDSSSPNDCVDSSGVVDTSSHTVQPKYYCAAGEAVGINERFVDSLDSSIAVKAIRTNSRFVPSMDSLSNGEIVRPNAALLKYPSADKTDDMLIPM